VIKNGKTLLSGLEPIRRAERAADAISLSDNTLYFCPSPIYGYGLDRLLSRLENTTSAVLCIEADPELYELSVKSIAQNKKLLLTNICDKSELVSLVFNKWGTRVFKRIETIRFSGGWQLFPKVYDDLCDTLRRELSVDWSNALTLIKLGRLYIRNAFRNLTSGFPSVSNLSFGSSPVLVLGAGPSMDKTLDALKNKFTDRSFKIICVDTCLGALRERNITPDLVVILESQHWNIRGFFGCQGWTVPAAFDLSALPLSASILKGQHYLFFTPWTHLNIFKRLKDSKLLPAEIPPLGSVGITAVELARRLTSGKIICAGLDFSFTHDMYHAKSTPGHRSQLFLNTRLKGVLNNTAYASSSGAAVSKNGDNVLTNPIMKNYRNLFEQEFAADERIFDIEGTGLPLGVKTLSLEEVAQVCEEISQRRGDAEDAEGRKEGEEGEDCEEISQRRGDAEDAERRGEEGEDCEEISQRRRDAEDAEGRGEEEREEEEKEKDRREEGITSFSSSTPSSSSSASSAPLRPRESSSQSPSSQPSSSSSSASSFKPSVCSPRLRESSSHPSSSSPLSSSSSASSFKPTVCGLRLRESSSQPSSPSSSVSSFKPTVCGPCLRESSSQTFFQGELKRLQELRGILAGELGFDKERLKTLISECDYLWAHFPDRPDFEDVSFLKRIRAEIDPMLSLIHRAI